MSATTTTTPHPTDVHVGRKLRTLRRLRGLSQTDLANASAITFQQVQKYERGANRVSASRLAEFAEALGVPVAEFFEGLDAGPARSVPPEVARITALRDSHEMTRLVEALARFDAPELRRALLAGFCAMAEGLHELGGYAGAEALAAEIIDEALAAPMTH